MPLRRPAVLLAAALIAAPAPLAAEPGWRWDLRYRTELVADDAFARDAEAHTARLRLGRLFEPAAGWQAYLEGEHVESVGNRYNSTANGRSGFPVVADPQTSEINQAWVAWQNERLGGTLGRQRILLDNQRFVGNVGWRQNEQTFDALSLRWHPAAGTTLQYTRLDRVHRVVGDSLDHDSHLLNLSGTPATGHTLAAYLYLLEDRDLPANSSSTLGMRWTGRGEPAALALAWTLEAARQTDYGNQPGSFSLGYYLFEPRLSRGGVSGWLGWERLEGDGRHGFSTPLATLHAFNGWADRFLAPPPAGLDDRYLGMSGRLGHARWTLIRHDFSAARGSAAYGSEWDASLGLPLPGRLPLDLLVKFADFRGDGPGPGVRKIWLQLEWRNP